MKFSVIPRSFLFFLSRLLSLCTGYGQCSLSPADRANKIIYFGVIVYVELYTYTNDDVNKNTFNYKAGRKFAESLFTTNFLLIFFRWNENTNICNVS